MAGRIERAAIAVPDNNPPRQCVNRVHNLRWVCAKGNKVSVSAELLCEPRWIGGLFRSFWAKFGMLNTPLPWPFYVWFAALSAAVVVGVRRLDGSQRLVLASALLANAGLVLAYQLTVDLQAQGRYLLPSLAAVAAFGSAGLAALPARLQPVLFWGAVVVALAAIAATAMAYS